MVSEPCLGPAQVSEIARLLKRAEALQGMPVEIEWALDDSGFKLLQARPLSLQPAQVPRASPASSPSAAAARRTSRRSLASAASRWCWASATPHDAFPTARRSPWTASRASSAG
jgi:phosphoenolpyruvate synthase/pyruvate phosphate dikinase